MEPGNGSVPVSIDAPVDGWDAFNSPDQMPPTAAIILNNLIPQPGRVETRLGYTIFKDLATGLPVETIASFDSESDSKLLAASNGGVWSISNDGVTLTQLAAPATFSNSRWQTENFRRADEVGVLVMCNGEDIAQIYNGTALSNISLVGTDPALSLDGFFVGCLTFKGRMYFWNDNDNAFYYTQAGSYQGEFQKFDLGTFTRRGGTLTLITSWTQQDSGDGKDDFLVFVFSTGEILIYQGDDPQTSGFFEMVGRYLTSEPLSIRGTSQFGADTILMTRDGYVALSTIIQEGRVSDVHQFSRIIHNAIEARTKTTDLLHGWEVQLFPAQGLMLFNIPLSDTVFEQHVLNTVTQKWCKFLGLNVNCMAVHNERLFGGTADGNIIAMLETTSDNGMAIQYDCMTAFNFFDTPGIQKHLVAAQVLSTISNPGVVNITGYADYYVPDLPPLTTLPAQTISSWASSSFSVDGSLWDEDLWSGEGTPLTTKGWQNVSAYGYAVALLIRFTSVNERVIWRSTGLRYFTGGAQ